MKISLIRETPTLLTDADSRTDTILERLRDLPIRTEKRTWSTRKCGLVHAKVGTRSTQKKMTWFALDHIPVFRALLEIEIKIEIELRNTSSFLGLYLRSRSRSRSRLHQSTDEAPSAPVRPRKKLHGKGTNRHTITRTCQLADQLGPEGRVGEKY